MVRTVDGQCSGCDGLNGRIVTDEVESDLAITKGELHRTGLRGDLHVAWYRDGEGFGSCRTTGGDHRVKRRGNARLADDGDGRSGGWGVADDLQGPRDGTESTGSRGGASCRTAAGGPIVVTIYRIDQVGVASHTVAMGAGVLSTEVAGAENRILLAIGIVAAVAGDALAAAAEVGRVGSACRSIIGARIADAFASRGLAGRGVTHIVRTELCVVLALAIAGAVPAGVRGNRATDESCFGRCAIVAGVVTITLYAQVVHTKVTGSIACILGTLRVGAAVTTGMRHGRATDATGRAIGGNVVTVANRAGAVDADRL